jgi:hypothetical protein
MSDQNPAAPAAPTPAPAAPAVDAAAIAQQAADMVRAEVAKVTADVTAKADAKLKHAARVLSGEPEATSTEDILETFLKDPVKTLHTVKEVAKREMREEQEQQDQKIRTERAVVGPMLNQYPGLKTDANSAAVEMIAGRLSKSGMSYAEALKAACEKVIKDNDLKSVSDAQRNGDANFAALPGSGGGSAGGGAPQRDEGKNAQDFITSMKNRVSSFKTRK